MRVSAHAARSRRVEKKPGRKASTERQVRDRAASRPARVGRAADVVVADDSKRVADLTPPRSEGPGALLLAGLGASLLVVLIAALPASVIRPASAASFVAYYRAEIAVAGGILLALVSFIGLTV